jgi:hypothetical protein
MKKQITLFLILLIVPIISEAQSRREISKWKIKSITSTVTEVKNGEQITYKNTYWAFDKNGNKIEALEFDKKGQPKKTESFIYNKYNKVAEHLIFNADGTIKKKELKKYDSLARLVEELTVDENGKEIEKKLITYNANGDKTEVIHHKKGDFTKTVYNYDKNGLKTSKETFDSKGNLLFSKKLEYQY